MDRRNFLSLALLSIVPRKTYSFISIPNNREYLLWLATNSIYGKMNLNSIYGKYFPGVTIANRVKELKQGMLITTDIVSVYPV